MNTHLGRCRDSWVAEDFEISFSPHGDVGYLYIFLMHFICNRAEENGANQAGRHQVCIANYAVQSNFVFIAKLLLYL
jgi:hypothetical protein